MGLRSGRAHGPATQHTVVAPDAVDRDGAARRIIERPVMDQPGLCRHAVNSRDHCSNSKRDNTVRTSHVDLLPFEKKTFLSTMDLASIARTRTVVNCGQFVNFQLPGTSREGAKFGRWPVNCKSHLNRDFTDFAPCGLQTSKCGVFVGLRFVGWRGVRMGVTFVDRSTLEDATNSPVGPGSGRRGAGAGGGAAR
jgi:hypothetical protein